MTCLGPLTTSMLTLSRILSVIPPPLPRTSAARRCGPLSERPIVTRRADEPSLPPLTKLLRRPFENTVFTGRDPDHRRA